MSKTAVRSSVGIFWVMSYFYMSEKKVCIIILKQNCDKEGMKKLNIILDYSMTRGIAGKMFGRYSIAPVNKVINTMQNLRFSLQWLNVM
jgi:hypothetical protein